MFQVVPGMMDFSTQRRRDAENFQRGFKAENLRFSALSEACNQIYFLDSSLRGA
jgi:hypothetical protein